MNSVLHYVHIGVIATMMGSISSSPALDELKERRVQIKTDCLYNETCWMLCILEKMGIIDENGRYVDSISVEWLKIEIDEGWINQNEANLIAKSCNRVNEDMKPGCARGDQVEECIYDCKSKVVYKKREIFTSIVVSCRDIIQPCFKLCVLQKMGIIDKDGRYVEGRSLDFLSIFMVDARLNSLLSQEVKKVVEACNRVNSSNTSGCQRGKQVAACLVEEMWKIPISSVSLPYEVQKLLS